MAVVANNNHITYYTTAMPYVAVKLRALLRSQLFKKSYYMLLCVTSSHTHIPASHVKVVKIYQKFIIIW
jgi:hypothetical protein